MKNGKMKMLGQILTGISNVFSRRKNRDCLKILEGKLDRAGLLSRFKKDSLEYDEINTFT